MRKADKCSGIFAVFLLLSGFWFPSVLAGPSRDRRSGGLLRKRELLLFGFPPVLARPSRDRQGGVPLKGVYVCGSKRYTFKPRSFDDGSG